MIDERYMFRGKRIDNLNRLEKSNSKAVDFSNCSEGEWETGYLMQFDNGKKIYSWIYNGLNDLKDNYVSYIRTSVDPATVEPVAVKVITEKHKMNEIEGSTNDFWITHYICPNCKNIIQQKREQINGMGKVNYTEKIKKFKYCYDCGQRLDWSEFLKGGGAE